MEAAEFAAMRKIMGVFREDLAQKLEVNPRTIQRWESGESPIPWGIEDEISEIFENFTNAVQAITDAAEASPIPYRFRFLKGAEDSPKKAEYNALLRVAWFQTYLLNIEAVAEYEDEELAKKFLSL